MRLLIITTAVLLLAAGPAIANDLVLEPASKPRTRPLFVQSDILKCVQLKEAPQTTAVPEGELLWIKIILGSKEYLACICTKGKEASMFVDTDNDLNLKEETPVSSKQRGNFWYHYFEINPLQGEFNLGDDVLKTDIKMRVMAYRRGKAKIRFSIYLYSCFQGRINAFDSEFMVTWVPGQEPNVEPVGKTMYTNNYHYGRKRIDIGSHTISLVNGKVVANWNVIKDMSLIGVSVPDGMPTVFANKMRSGKRHMTACFPVNGKIYLSKGMYSYMRGEVKFKDGDDNWKISLICSKFQVEEGATFGNIEPLCVPIKVTVTRNAVKISPSIQDASGSRVRLFKNNKLLPAPKLVICDSKGNLVTERTLRYR